MPLPKPMLNPDTVTDTVTVMAVPTDTVTVMAVPTDTTVESAPLMPNPKPRLPLLPLPRLMPLLYTVTVTTVMVDITDTPTVTDTVIIMARGNDLDFHSFECKSEDSLAKLAVISHSNFVINLYLFDINSISYPNIQ